MDRAIEDIKKGRVYEASNVEDLCFGVKLLNC